MNLNDFSRKNLSFIIYSWARNVVLSFLFDVYRKNIVKKQMNRALKILQSHLQIHLSTLIVSKKMIEKWVQVRNCLNLIANNFLIQKLFVIVWHFWRLIDANWCRIFHVSTCKAIFDKFTKSFIFFKKILFFDIKYNIHNDIDFHKIINIA